MRRLTLLGPADASAYAHAVSRVTPAVERRLGPEVFANRVPGGGSLEPWRAARIRWRRSAGRLVAAGPSCALDVLACYDSIHPEVVGRALEHLGIADVAGREIVSVLAAFRGAGVPGIPVGPAPSAVLANAVLANVDMHLRRNRVRFVRWVDDILISGDTHSLDAGERALEVALGELGLRSNASKRRRFPDREAANAFLFGTGAGHAASGLR
ncbi:MAG: RNA-directed DNA polymerase [Actinomycetota bacterium]